MALVRIGFGKSLIFLSFIFLIVTKPVHAQTCPAPASEPRGVVMELNLYQISPPAAPTPLPIATISVNGDTVYVLDNRVDLTTKVDVHYSALPITTGPTDVPWVRQLRLRGTLSSANVVLSNALWQDQVPADPYRASIFSGQFINQYIGNFYPLPRPTARSITASIDPAVTNVLTFNVAHRYPAPPATPTPLAADEIHTINFCGDRCQPVLSGNEHVAAIESGGTGSPYPAKSFSDKNGRMTNLQGDVRLNSVVQGHCQIQFVLASAPPAVPTLPPVFFDDANPQHPVYSDPLNGAIDARHPHNDWRHSQCGALPVCQGACKNPSAANNPAGQNWTICQENNFQGWSDVLIRFDGDVGYFWQEVEVPQNDPILDPLVRTIFGLSEESLYTWPKLNRNPRYNYVSQISRPALTDARVVALGGAVPWDAPGGDPALAENMVLVTFAREIDYATWTTIEEIYYSHDSLKLGSLPGDVNQNMVSTERDCQMLHDTLLGGGVSSLPDYRSDLNRDNGTAQWGIPNNPIDDFHECQKLLSPTASHGSREFRVIKLPCNDVSDTDNLCDDEV